MTESVPNVVRSTRIVSFLGLGPPKAPAPYYDPVVYEIDDDRGNKLRTARTAIKDVASALIAAPSRSMVMVGTVDTQMRWFGKEKTFETLLNQGMEDSIQGTKGHCPVAFELIPFGKDREERWQIFDTMVRLLMPGASTFGCVSENSSAVTEECVPTEIVMDITHGFRSAPFFAASALAYVNSEIKRRGMARPTYKILYAHYEPEPAKVDGYVAPIWDFSQLIEVLDWDNAIDGLMRFGRADDLAALVQREQSRAYAEVEPANRRSVKFKEFGESAKTFADALATVRVPSLITELSGKLSKAVTNAGPILGDRIPPIKSQLDQLKQWADELSAPAVVSKQGVRAGIALARRYLELQRYAEAYAVFRETLVSLHGLRLFGNSALQPGAGGPQPSGGQIGQFDDQRESYEFLLGRLSSEVAHSEQSDPLVLSFNAHAGDRNDVLHAGFRGQPAKAGDLMSRMTKRVRECVEWIEPALENLKESGSSRFINVSNHPSAKWDTTQRQAATILGAEIVDIPFPNIPATESAKQVCSRVDELVCNIVSHNPSAVYVAGEFTFTFALVTTLKSRNIRCVSATTERVSEDTLKPDGTVEKVSRFKFVAWREY